MKALSLTLSIVIIAIVLLVTALVILTIFGSQMSKILETLGLVTDESLAQNSCRQRCATYCMANIGSDPVDWSKVDKDNKGDCNDVMGQVGITQCKCS